MSEFHTEPVRFACRYCGDLAYYPSTSKTPIHVIAPPDNDAHRPVPPPEPLSTISQLLGEVTYDQAPLMSEDPEEARKWADRAAAQEIIDSVEQASLPAFRQEREGNWSDDVLLAGHRHGKSTPRGHVVGLGDWTVELNSITGDLKITSRATRDVQIIGISRRVFRLTHRGEDPQNPTVARTAR